MSKPDLVEVLRNVIESRLADVHTSLPGRVIAYNAATQRADVQIVVRSAVVAKSGAIVNEELPVLPDVPVAWLRGGGCSLQLPLTKGDHVWLLFSESALGQWRVTGSLSDPGDLARHSLGYPIAIPCVAPDTQPLTPPVGNEALLQVAQWLRVGGPSADYVALSSLVTLALQALSGAIAAAATTETNAGGLGGMTALAANLQTITWPPAVAATKLKSE